MKFPSFMRLFGERWQRQPSSRRRSRRSHPFGLHRKTASLTLEALEDRTLLAVVPTPLVSGWVHVDSSRGNESSPAVAVDPTNAQKLFAVYQRNDPQNPAPPNGRQIFNEGAYSTNGG